MNRRVRPLLVAAACQALVGLVAVSTGVSRPDPPTEDEPGSSLTGGSAVGEGGAAPGQTPSGEPATSASEAESSSTPLRPGASAGGGRTATSTTARTGGITSTTMVGVTTTTTTTQAASGPKCPNPKTCDIYEIINETDGGPRGGTKGWRPDSDGTVRVRFFVNPAPPAGSGLTEDTMETAFLEGTRIIEAADPRLRFVYQGRTTKGPDQFDGVSVFTFGDAAWHRFDGDGYITEADIGPKAGATAGGWAYTPCEQRDGGCSKSATGKSEILNTIVHEEMHTMGLADLSHVPETLELTMYPGNMTSGERHHVTLGLGDVLGLRALYPTSAPMPPIYAP